MALNFPKTCFFRHKWDVLLQAIFANYEEIYQKLYAGITSSSLLDNYSNKHEQ